MLNGKGLAKQFSQGFFSEGKKGLAKQFFPRLFCTRSVFSQGFFAGTKKAQRSNFPNGFFAREAIFRKPCEAIFPRVFSKGKKAFSKRLRAKKGLSEKGQESAPFELLVAVIIMGFVIFIGTRVMQDVNCEKCKGETNKNLNNMVTALNDAETGAPIQISFFLSGCFNQQEEKIWIDDEDNDQVCAAYCGAEKELCTLLKYYGNGCGGFSIIKCLEITPETYFPSTTGGRCKERQGMQLVDFRERDEPIATRGNKQGNYLLVNKKGQGETFSTICAYRKED